MLSLKDFIDDSEDTILESSGKFHDTRELPNVLVMRKKSVRQFQNGQRVALYQIDGLNRYVTVPYGNIALTAEETEVIEEDVMHHLNNIASNHTAKTIKFKDGSSMKVDVQTAHAILKVHGAVNDTNKQKLADMAHKSKTHFKRVADFAWKNVSYKPKD